MLKALIIVSLYLIPVSLIAQPRLSENEEISAFQKSLVESMIDDRCVVGSSSHVHHPDVMVEFSSVWQRNHFAAESDAWVKFHYAEAAAARIRKQLIPKTVQSTKRTLSGKAPDSLTLLHETTISYEIVDIFEVGPFPPYVALEDVAMVRD